MPYRIGLTGNIACGKSTVGRLLVARGAEYVDADRLVHALMEPWTTETDAIAARFGAGVRDADGRIDRKVLGALVWVDPAALRDLEAILHPGVRAEVGRRLAATTARVIVVDAIKLIESDLHRAMDAVWVVTCPHAEQARRLVATRGLTPAEAEARIAAQETQEEKVRHATVVLRNDGTLEGLETQVESAWQQIPSS